MIRLKRRNTVWLTAMLLLTTIGIIAASAFPLIQFMLLAAFGLSAVASTVELGRERETLIDALRHAPIRNRISPQAKEAQERAKSRGGYTNNNLMMLDVGLIAVQSSYEGMAMRRTRSISKDDDGARPFVALNVEASEAERHAMIRFEIFNQYGEQKFVHEMRAFLREGEMNIMTDHHMPLAGNQDVQGTGDWDLRVYVDGNLVGMHNFMLAPSMTDRQRRLVAEDDIDMGTYQIVDEVQQDVTPRLQDLLQSQRQEQQVSSTSRLSDNNSTSSTTGNTQRTRSRTATRRRR
ncbi:MAG: hypothetical protein Phog2KO_07640 [Phototrophicaceae bacterium]